MNEQQNRNARPFHSRQAQEAVEQLGSNVHGLSTDEVKRRREEYGPNTIEKAGGVSALRILLGQIHNPLIYVLLVSGGLAIAMGKIADGAVVLGVVVVNALIGFVQEYRAGKAIESLSAMVPEFCTVLRDGHRDTVGVAELVPGDIVALQSGDKVPADMRLLEQRGLFVNESALTGESVPVLKSSDPLPEPTALPDRLNMAYGGTFVTAGTGQGLVVRTGMATELGRISSMIGSASSLRTPLTEKMEQVARLLTVVIVVISVLLLVVGMVRGYALADATLVAIAMAVAAIPEGLPAIITIAMAIGVRRMARRHAIIRRLPAVEILGSTRVVCSDKTGTLTKNEMTVQALWTPEDGSFEVTGAGYEPDGEIRREGQRLDEMTPGLRELLLGGVLCADADVRLEEGRWTPHGDPTEVAMVVAAIKGGMNPSGQRQAHPRLDAVPFESERQYMATLHDTARGRTLFVKGAPEILLQRCDASEPTQLEAARDQVHEMATRGMRVLAVAIRADVAGDEMLAEQEVSALRLVGLQGMIDPPRPEAVAAIAKCRQAGIEVRMITGDHPRTAGAIAVQLGLPHAEHVTIGSDIDTMDDETLSQAVETTGVFARVAPEHKIRLVRLLQAKNYVVAMTGDGVNDAPALKQADIGVAMGITGTAVSKEASDIVLTDDNFATIAAAVEEGRRIYDNLVKALGFVLPTNLGEGLIVVLAVAFFPIVNGVPLVPIEPVQILWINLVAAVTLALPLAFEAMEPDVMERPPRKRSEPILGRFVLTRTVVVGMLMAAGAIGQFLYDFYVDVNPEIGSEQALREAQTMAVSVIVLFQVFYLIMSRSLTRSILSVGLWSNKTIYLGVGAILGLQGLYVYWPGMNRIFHSAPLPAVEWLEMTVVAFTVIPVVALEKWLWRRFSRSSARPGG